MVTRRRGNSIALRRRRAIATGREFSSALLMDDRRWAPIPPRRARMPHFAPRRLRAALVSAIAPVVVAVRPALIVAMPRREAASARRRLAAVAPGVVSRNRRPRAPSVHARGGAAAAPTGARSGASGHVRILVRHLGRAAGREILTRRRRASRGVVFIVAIVIALSRTVVVSVSIALMERTVKSGCQ